MKRRADILLVEKGLVDSRARAQRLILAGQVRIGCDHVIAKTAELVDDQADVRIAELYPYVSRGAEKLLAGLHAFPVQVEGATALDVGASTGGFTDLLLQSGAARVYAVDVGHGQLHDRLRRDPRVISLEHVNARHLGAEQIPEPVDLLVADVSFISLTLILPACAKLLKPGGYAFLLIKPQFEARREEVETGGVVRDEGIRARCVEKICAFATQCLGWRLRGVVPSPIKGPKGNQEFVAAFHA